MRDESRLVQVERIARAHGLNSKRTASLRSFRHRNPDINPEFIEWLTADEIEKQKQKPDVLWVYADAALEPQFAGAADGFVGVAAVLGYPECCVLHNSETKLASLEAYIRGIVRTFNPASTADLIGLWKDDVQVAVELDPDRDVHQTGTSLKQFPYVQLVACPPCLADAESPAARVNRQMRDLAFNVSPTFGRAIWEARNLIVNKGKRIDVGRNEACPCGSGAKFKKCCLTVT